MRWALAAALAIAGFLSPFLPAVLVDGVTLPALARVPAALVPLATLVPLLTLLLGARVTRRIHLASSLVGALAAAIGVLYTWTTLTFEIDGGATLLPGGIAILVLQAAAVLVTVWFGARPVPRSAIAAPTEALHARR